MDKIIKQFVMEARKITLLSGEKNSIRKEILAYARNHPLSQTAPQPTPAISIDIFRTTTSQIFGPSWKYMPALALFAILITGTSMAVAAENALPGEILHPIKISINENTMSLLAFSQEDKAKLAIKKTGRRLEEIERLAAKNKLNANELDEMRNKIKGNIDLASSIIAEIENKKGRETTANLQSDLETVLLAHNGILNNLRFGNYEVEIKIKDLRNEVKIKTDDLVEKRAEIEKEMEKKEDRNVEIPAREKLRSAENKLREARHFINAEKKEITPQVINEAENLLKSADEAISQGKTKVEAGEYGEAFVLFQKAFRLAQTAHHLTTVSAKINGSATINEPFKTQEEKTGSPEEEIESKTEDKTENSEQNGDGEEGSGGTTENKNEEEKQNEYPREIRLNATLVGETMEGVLPSGRAEFEKKEGKTFLNIAVENIALPASVELKALLANNFLGTLTSSNRNLRLPSEDGANIPDVNPGDTIKIVDPTGKVILSGSFQDDR